MWHTQAGTKLNRSPLIVDLTFMHNHFPFLIQHEKTMVEIQIECGKSNNINHQSAEWGMLDCSVSIPWIGDCMAFEYGGHWKLTMKMMIHNRTYMQEGLVSFTSWMFTCHNRA